MSALQRTTIKLVINVEVYAEIKSTHQITAHVSAVRLTNKHDIQTRTCEPYRPHCLKSMLGSSHIFIITNFSTNNKVSR